MGTKIQKKWDNWMKYLKKYFSTSLVINFGLEDWGRLSIFAPSINKMFAYEESDDDSCTDVHNGFGL